MYHGDDLPRLSTFTEALVWYQSRQPYKRGRSKGLRPLGNNRRYDRSLISTLTDADGKVGSVTLSFHTCLVITFYPDDSVVLKHGSWETVGTMDFINTVLRDRFNKLSDANREHFDMRSAKWAGITRRRGKLYFCDGSLTASEHRFEGVLRLEANNEVTGGAFEYEWVLNKEKMARVIKHYAEFTEYLTYYSQMVGTRVASEIIQQKKLTVVKGDLRWNGKPQIREREEFFFGLNLAMMVTGEDKLTNFLPLAEQVAVNAASKQYNWAAQMYTYVITPQMARDFFYDLCRYHYAEYLFSREVVEKGKVVLDENSKYVDYKSDAAPMPFAI